MTASSPSKEIIHAQVAILGAGPAGTAAALHLGQLGVQNVVLVDREDFPREKTCGSGISPKGIETLKALGVWDDVKALAYPIKGLRLVTPEGHEAFISGGESAAAVVCRRRELDHALLRRAQGLGVRFIPKFLVRELLEDDGRVTGFRALDGREVHARFTLVADGAHSSFTPRDEKKQLIHAIMGWWEDVPFTPQHVEMVFDPLVLPWYGWLFPESASLVNIGICYGDDGHTRNARTLFQQFLDKHYADRLRGARQVGAWKGHPISYSFQIKQLHTPGRIIIGEAGRMTHPATAEGISQGMRTGMFAAEAIHQVVRHVKDEVAAFNAYQRRCQTAFLPSYLGAKAFQGVLKTPLLDWMAKLGEQTTVKRITGRLMAQM
jgi:geranylgeranyl reductase family protein